MGDSRRNFLKKSIGLVGLSAAAPHLWVRPALASGPAAGDASRVLVVLQLGGGNDGLNTVVPHAQGAYYDARPTLAIPESSVIDLDGSVGFHPSMAALMPLYEAGKLAVVQGAGYPQPNRSHFRSMEIWHTADPAEVDATGWLGRYADAHLAGGGDLAAVSIGDSLPKSLHAEQFVVPSIRGLESYAFNTDPRYEGDRGNQVDAFLSANTRRAASGYEAALARTAVSAYEGSAELQSAAGAYTPRATYPEGRLARDLQFAAQIIVAGVGARVVYLRTSGYDTHANQPDDHANLLRQMSEGLAAFQTDLEGQGLADRVAVLAFSEFGRRVRENGSSGTDHGTAGPMFLLGSGVSGGLQGEHPSLTALDNNDDLVFTVDFRSVYADALQGWLGVDSAPILEGEYAPLGLFRG
jgi:uncharacterized protein (DUF1501 family)